MPAKAPLQGLVSQGTLTRQSNSSSTSQPINTLTNIQMFPPGIFGGVVCNVNWNQLEAVQGTYDYSVIDNFLTLVRGYNSANPQFPLGVRLRIYTGVHAPAWALAFGSGPVTIYQKPVTNQFPLGTPVVVGNYWDETNYLAAYWAMQSALAARYDANEPLIRSVTISHTGSNTTDPFNESLDTPSIANLIAAGRTDALMQSALLGNSIGNYPWRDTQGEYSFATFNQLDSGTARQLASFTNQCINTWRSSLGFLGDVANHALKQTVTSPENRFYPTIAANGPPTSFQVGLGLYQPGPPIVDNLTPAIQLGVFNYSADSIEIHDIQGGDSFINYPLSLLQSLAAVFTQTPPP
ncbi:MAG TPA: hypothetical protein VKD24_03450 [Candidatus Angelobacter sp.]|nr:hypothetical protein [Candidatus Angelobacter sp.]